MKSLQHILPVLYITCLGHEWSTTRACVLLCTMVPLAASCLTSLCAGVLGNPHITPGQLVQKTSLLLSSMIRAASLPTLAAAGGRIWMPPPRSRLQRCPPGRKIQQRDQPQTRLPGLLFLETRAVQQGLVRCLPTTWEPTSAPIQQCSQYTTILALAAAWATLRLLSTHTHQGVQLQLACVRCRQGFEEAAAGTHLELHEQVVL